LTSSGSEELSWNFHCSTVDQKRMMMKRMSLKKMKDLGGHEKWKKQGSVR
jgi:hypothetical protein